jgi:hypothetical protein
MFGGTGDLDREGDLDGSFGNGTLGGPAFKGCGGRVGEAGLPRSADFLFFLDLIGKSATFGGGGRSSIGGSPGTKVKFSPTVGELFLSWSLFLLVWTVRPSTAVFESSGCNVRNAGRFLLPVSEKGFLLDVACAALSYKSAVTGDNVCILPACAADVGTVDVEDAAVDCLD